MKVEFYDQYLWPVRAAAGRAVGDWIERVYNGTDATRPSVWSARSSTKTDSIRRHKPPDPVSAKRGQAQSIPAPTQQALRTLERVHRARNLIVCGPAGHCKTFLPGLHVDWFSLESLGVLVRRHRVDDTVTKAITRILRSDLVMVMVDDIGLLAVGTDATVR